MNNKKNIIVSSLIVILLMTLSSLIGIVFRQWHWPDTNIILIYILAVLMTARLTKGYVYGVVSSIIATFLFNYFFTDPLYTLSVYDSKYMVTFIVMTLTALVTSASTSRIQISTQLATENAQYMKILYTLTNSLSDILDYKSLICKVINLFSEVFNSHIGCICFQKDNGYIYMYGNNHDIQPQNIDDILDYQAHFEHLQESYIEIDGYYHYPLYGIGKVLGVLIIEKKCVNSMDDSQNKLLISMIENVSLALDHIYSIQEQFLLKETTVKERYRSNLLRSISHDLRTPLSGIMGTSEMIMDIQESHSETYDLAQGIYEEANWLYLLVENILSLTKIQEGKLNIKKQYEAIEEVIGSAIHHVTKNKKNYKINVNVPDEVLMVPMDATLIEQVFINILDNAIKYSSFDEPIYIQAKCKGNDAFVYIEDYGEGFRDNNPEKIFEMFYSDNKNQSSDSSKGVGLGLTICKAIIEAHGGKLSAMNCEKHRGARFVIQLPMEDEDETKNISC